MNDADEAVEADLRAVLADQRPDDAVLGEEYGGTAAFGGRQWVIDPIDGTKNFVRGCDLGQPDRPAGRRRADRRRG